MPIVLSIDDEIDEDPSVTDVAERWRRFGQDDHVRLYSKQGLLKKGRRGGICRSSAWSEIFWPKSVQAVRHYAAECSTHSGDKKARQTPYERLPTSELYKFADRVRQPP